MAKRKVENSENESVANHSEMNWAETIKGINVHKRKPGDRSRKCEVLLGVICVLLAKQAYCLNDIDFIPVGGKNFSIDG